MKTSNSGTSRATLPAPRVLVVDDHAPARESMCDILRQAGHEVDAAVGASQALARMKTESYDVVLTDLQMPGMSGLEFLRQIRQRDHGPQVILVTGYASVSTAVEAMRDGAFDYIEKPFDAEQLEGLVARAIQQAGLIDQRATISGPASMSASMVGSSEVMQRLRGRVAQVARSQETVLICGESGTGKELVARAVHAASPRSAAPLVSLNCPVLSAQLMESELFGHERGAFTGADAPRTGRFELADHGTILLDEITEIEPHLQAKLLRVLQERSFERVGSSATLHVDVRVLATTNRDLLAEVAAGRFREDLYYRLAVLPLAVPPLRERRDDVPELVDHFRNRAAERLQVEPCEFTRAALDLLVHYDWPGNVRELENIVTRASVLSGGAPVSADELQPWLLRTPEHGPAAAALPVGLSLHEMERKLIESTLERFGGHREKTAKALGIGIRTLSGKLKTYGYAPRTKNFASAA
ncbi:MAG: sigma-54 dependent transcriptional regulator [Pirellulales bacterium]|nr:sigma-54 dependent transcriptional regulator [Pirellulales bacterium]